MYYRVKEKTLGSMLPAGLVSTPSIVHVAGLEGAPRSGDSKTEVDVVNLSDRAFRSLIRAIASSLKRGNATRAKSVANERRLDSNFYYATSKFHLFNPCNTWSTCKLYAGSEGVSPSGFITADKLMACLRAPHGTA